MFIWRLAAMIRNLNNSLRDLKGAAQSFLRVCWFCSFLKSYFISTAGSTSGSDHRGETIHQFRCQKISFLRSALFPLAGNLARLCFPPKSAEFYRHSSTWSPDRMLLSSLWDMAGLLTAWVLHCRMTLISCERDVSSFCLCQRFVYVSPSREEIP